MKKETVYLLLVFTILIASCSSSERLSPQEALPGIWNIAEINTDIKLNPELLRRGESELKKADIIINQDGTGSIVTGSRSREGRWSLSTDSESIILTDEGSENTVNAKILTLTDEKMVLETKIMGGTVKAELIKKK